MKNVIILKKQPFFGDDFLPVNYEPKLPLTLVLDISSSMRGKGIKELNEGIRLFIDFITGDAVALARLELAVVTFGTEVNVSRDFSPVNTTYFYELKAGGRTLLKQGIEKALDLLYNRKMYYKSIGLQYYRPQILLITDGYPWPDKELGNLPEIIKSGTENKKFVFQAFGAGNANMDVLNSLSHALYSPQLIDNYNFSGFFKWLAPSVSTVVSKSVDISMDYTQSRPFAFNI